MIRSEVSNEDISRAIDRDVRTVRNKMSGTTEFTFSEATIIRDNFFPTVSLEYLFEK